MSHCDELIQSESGARKGLRGSLFDLFVSALFCDSDWCASIRLKLYNDVRWSY